MLGSDCPGSQVHWFLKRVHDFGYAGLACRRLSTRSRFKQDLWGGSGLQASTYGLSFEFSMQLKIVVLVVCISEYKCMSTSVRVKHGNFLNARHSRRKSKVMPASAFSPQQPSHVQLCRTLSSFPSLKRNQSQKDCHGSSAGLACWGFPEFWRIRCAHRLSALKMADMCNVDRAMCLKPLRDGRGQYKRHRRKKN